MRIPGNFDRWMFNYKEGNLSAEEAAYFESFMLNDPDYVDDIEAWDNAYVRKETIAYPGMNSLLQEKKTFFNWKSIAASILILLSVSGGIGLGNYFFNKSEAAKALYKSRLNFNYKYSNSFNQSFFGIVSSHKEQSSTNKSGIEKVDISKSTLKSSTIVKPTKLVGQQTSLSQLNLKAKQKLEQQSEQNSDAEINNDGFYSTEFSTQEQNAGQQNSYSRQGEMSKIKGGDDFHSGRYSFNPNIDFSPLDLSYKKNRSKNLAFYLKRIFRKLDKITGYPIALVNLRDPELVIPNRNILNFNPGFAGSGGNLRVGADYRNQWTGESVMSQSATMYFDNYNHGTRGGIGGSITYSDYNGGAYRSMLANLYYSPKFMIGKHVVFEPAIKLTMGRLDSNPHENGNGNAIEFNRGNVVAQNPDYSKMSNNFWFKDYGLGFVINTDWFYVGGFVDNLAGHDQRIYTPDAQYKIESPKLVTAVLGFDYQSRNRRTTLSPFLSYYQYGAKKELWAGATAQFNWLTIGASYSSNNEYAASVGLKFKSFKLIYQIDMLESEFLQESFVSHNIGIRFNTKNKTTR